jgi:hypothetical protein
MMRGKLRPRQSPGQFDHTLLWTAPSFRQASANRTIKDATVKRYHYDSHDQLRQHLQLFIDAYNHGRRLKTLRGLTPYEYFARIWTEDPNRFKLDPYRHTPGPNT